MSIATPSCNSPWGLVEWAITGLVTLAASIGAFVWRLTLRLETIEATLTRARQEVGEARQASDAAAQRLAERVDQLRDEACRLRESISALPTREELRSLDERMSERSEALATRLDRLLGA